jgi:hypothetical protein
MKRASALRLLAGGLAAPLAACSEKNTMVVPQVNPASSPPTTFGVQMYPSDDLQTSFALITACKGKIVRLGLTGNPDDPGRLAAFMPAAAAAGLRVVLLTAAVPQPVDVNQYAAYYVAIQKLYASYNPIWEIWNEPNLAAFWGTTPNVSDYASLALTVGKALRSAGATDIWSGGMSGLNAGWLNGLLQANLFSVLTGCGVHSYEPVGAALDHYMQLKAMLPSGILLQTTETGVPTDADQVDFFTGMWYVHRQLSLPTMIWVEFRDGSAGTSGPNAYPYGLVTAAYEPKLEYYTAQNLVDTAN